MNTSLVAYLNTVGMMVAEETTKSTTVSNLETIIGTVCTIAEILIAAVFVFRIFSKVFKLAKGSGEIKLGDIFKEVLYAVIIIACLSLVRGLTTQKGVLWDLVNLFSDKGGNALEQGIKDVLPGSK